MPCATIPFWFGRGMSETTFLLVCEALAATMRQGERTERKQRQGAYLYEAGTEENDHEINADSGNGAGNGNGHVRSNVPWNSSGDGDRSDWRCGGRGEGVGQKCEHWFGTHHADQRRWQLHRPGIAHRQLHRDHFADRISDILRHCRRG